MTDLLKKRTRTVKISREITLGAGRTLGLLAGPCVIESRDGCIAIAKKLAAWSRRTGVPFVFKASYDKANRSSIGSYRGPGLYEGLDILAEVKELFGVPVVTDIHEPWHADVVSEVADIIQIPAFLCRQTDLVLAAAETGLPIAVKKGQFLAAEDMRLIIEKIESKGNNKIILMDRGNSFGYGNLVADMRNLLIMAETGYPVVFDATHSVQRPGGAGGVTGGDGKWVPALARAAAATGALSGLFMETHPDPSKALSDKANALPLAKLPALWTQIVKIAAIAGGKATAR